MGFDSFDKQFAEGTAESALREKAASSYGTRSGFSTFYRYVVLDVVFDPQIVDDKKVSYWEHELGVQNIKFANVLPRNTIIGRRVLEGTASTNEPAMFLFPFFPPFLSMPCNPGEHVWVGFESKETKRSDLGYWMCRIVGPGYVDDVNHTHMPRINDPSFQPGTKDAFDGKTSAEYEFRPGGVEIQDGTRVSSYETATLPSSDENAYEKLMTDSDGGRLRRYEPIPRYRKRPDALAFEGTNNALIVVGQHRTGEVATYSDDPNRGKLPSLPDHDLVNGAGAIDIVAGRGQTDKTLGDVVENSIGQREVRKDASVVSPNEGDPDFKNDRSRVFVAQKSKVDLELGLDRFNGTIGITDADDGDGAVFLKSDKVRVMARSDIELFVSGFERDDNGNMVEVTDTSKCAAIIITASGDIILKPSVTGVLKLGGVEADKALVCTDAPAQNVGGTVVAPGPIVTTMGGAFAGTNIAGQGRFARKVLVVG